MKKKWIAVLLAATMVFGATACSSGNEEKKDSKKEADSGRLSHVQLILNTGQIIRNILS